MEIEGLEGRTVIVVGAGGGGIGTGIALGVAEAGARVVAVDRDAERLERVLEAAPQGFEIVGKTCDASDPDQVAALIQDSAADSQLLHGLVNVVGGLPLDRWHAIIDDDDENFDALLESNLRVALRTSRAFARAVADSGNGGSLVQIASIAALEGMPYGAGYAAAKAALLSLVRTMAIEWGALDLRVNAVAPGSVVVPRGSAPPDLARDANAIPLRRRGEPADVANAVLFLLSDLSTWMTGQVLTIDGGVSIKPSYLDEDGLPVFVHDEGLRERLRAGPGKR